MWYDTGRYPESRSRTERRKRETFAIRRGEGVLLGRWVAARVRGCACVLPCEWAHGCIESESTAWGVGAVKELLIIRSGVYMLIYGWGLRSHLHLLEAGK